jgi:hypothetical protein
MWSFVYTTVTTKNGTYIVRCICLGFRNNPCGYVFDRTSRKNGLCVDCSTETNRGSEAQQLWTMHRFVRYLVHCGGKDDLVLFSESGNVLCCADVGDIVESYLRYGADIVLAGRDPQIRNVYDERNYCKLVAGSQGTYRYVSSSMGIGKAGTICAFLDENPYDFDTDIRLWWTRQLFSKQNKRYDIDFLRDPCRKTLGSIEVDRFGKLFVRVSNTTHRLRWTGKKFYDRSTTQYPAFLHFDSEQSVSTYYDMYLGKSCPIRIQSYRVLGWVTVFILFGTILVLFWKCIQRPKRNKNSIL